MNGFMKKNSSCIGDILLVLLFLTGAEILTMYVINRVAALRLEMASRVLVLSASSVMMVTMLMSAVCVIRHLRTRRLKAAVSDREEHNEQKAAA